MLLTFPVAQLRDLLKSAEASWPKGQRALGTRMLPSRAFGCAAIMASTWLALNKS